MSHKEWDWVDIVKPPKSKVLPDVLSSAEIKKIINGTRELRYQSYILTTYSMGLRLGETLNLTVGDIDSERMKVHVRQGTNSRRFRRRQKGPLRYIAGKNPVYSSSLLGDPS